MSWYLVGEAGGEHDTRGITDASADSEQSRRGDCRTDLPHDNANGVETSGTETVRRLHHPSRDILCHLVNGTYRDGDDEQRLNDDTS